MSKISEDIRADMVSSMSIEQIFQKHIIDGPSYFFKVKEAKPNLEYELRGELASVLDVNIHDVIIVGSAKLGFSVKTYEFNAFDSKFTVTRNPRDRSDIDIAVVNRDFFDKTARTIYKLSRHYDSEWARQNWAINRFYKDKRRRLDSAFCTYIARGWLRPDYLPVSFYEAAPWLKVSEKWSGALQRRRVSIGFYSEWFYLKNYQMGNLESIRDRISALEI